MGSHLGLLTLVAIFQAQDRERARPPALAMRDGELVDTVEMWRTRRRPEILELFAEHVYGRSPGRPEDLVFRVTAEDSEAIDGAATRRSIAISWGVGPPIELLLFLPNDREAPAPAFLGLNFYGNHSVIEDASIPLSTRWIPNRAEGVDDNRATEAARGTAASRWSIAQTIERGYAVATLYHGDIDPDRPDFGDGVQARYYETGQTRPAADEWGTIAAWAWGLSRAMDYLETDEDIDASRVAVMGHSRNGKTALLAGARDARFALVVSNQSGCGGAALSRRRVGETVRAINDRFPHWFCANFAKFNDAEDRLPIDQHLLIAAIAPRPVLVCSAVEDRWADPEGEFLALVGAAPVYRLLGTDALAVEKQPEPNRLVASRLGYHLRPGRHRIGPADWTVFCDFADRQLPAK